MTTGNTTTLTIWTFSGKVMSLLFNTLSRCAIAFLPRRKHPIILGKAFDCMDHNKLRKIFKETEIPDHLTCLLRNLYAKQLELDMEQIGSKSGKEYVKAVYCHPAYLTYMQSTS